MPGSDTVTQSQRHQEKRARENKDITGLRSRPHRRSWAKETPTLEGQGACLDEELGPGCQRTLSSAIRGPGKGPRVKVPCPVPEWMMKYADSLDPPRGDQLGSLGVVPGTWGGREVVSSQQAIRGTASPLERLSLEGCF